MNALSDKLLQSSILIVDDEPANVALLSQMLEDSGYVHVSSTTDSREVLGMHARQHFDLILLDVRMPHMSGIDVLQALAPMMVEDWSPVIVLTAQIDDKTREAALSAGARDFLTKPLRQWEVLLRISNMLEIRQYYKDLTYRAAHLEEQVRDRTQKIYDTQLMLIDRLGRAGEFRDNGTGNHIVRVSRSCELLARAAGLPEHQVELIRLASPMHDVGKIGIPDAVLLKPGSLSPEERVQMNRHVIIGSEIVGDHGDEILAMARIMALYHHEKWDGTGYPHGLRGVGIPLPARIVAICDVYDALTAVRPYKGAWSPSQALAHIQEQAGHHFDPDLVRAFASVFDQVVALRDTMPD